MKFVMMASVAVVSVGLISIAAFQFGRLFILEVLGIVTEAWRSPNLN